MAYAVSLWAVAVRPDELNGQLVLVVVRGLLQGTLHATLHARVQSQCQIRLTSKVYCVKPRLNMFESMNMLTLKILSSLRSATEGCPADLPANSMSAQMNEVHSPSVSQNSTRASSLTHARTDRGIDMSYGE